MYKINLSNRYLLGTLIAGLTVAIIFVSFASGDPRKVQGSRNEPEKMQDRPLVASMTVTPEVPSQVVFCGQTVDLARYDRHEGLDRELSSYTYLHSTTMLLLKRANRYFPVIEPILKKNGIPDDFKYLAVIESSLDPKASSPVRATGMWQFMEATGRQYGLTITPTVDERSHIEKSTQAACRYLKDAYARYGDWLNVASSYNAGMGRISGEKTHQDVDLSLDMWLVDETLRYPYRILAVKQIFENPYQYGFIINPKDLYKPIKTREVTVSSDIADLIDFAKKNGVNYADLKRFNPWLRDRKLITGGKKFVILIPEEDDMYYKQPNTFVHDSRWVMN